MCRAFSQSSSSSSTLASAYNEKPTVTRRPSKKRARTVKFPKTKSGLEKVVTFNDVNQDGWYSRQEYMSFRYGAQELCQRLVQCQAAQAMGQCIPEDVDIEIRGLEQIVDKRLAKERKRQRLRTIKSVLIAQDMARAQLQEREDVDVEGFVALVASRESTNARRFAELMGQADEQAVLGSEVSCCNTIFSAAA
eukprot:CAMPEP_0116844098 /NCGR_PEP_ID=MMETSP0418-20121206/12473_1 /TAXON_ID=1158023 /ORGANISM="Astrosyne radiata, Strain 13vi08-1A" /LENGTH=192 /DNA_ID=CAMNT_0004474961 /DNA_START=90 /DNA_END=668 /DNA_ORIENTATION=-